MKLVVPALLLLLAPQIAQAEKNDNSARRFVDAWVKSFNENDAKKIVAFYEADERVEMLASNGMSLKGYKEISNSYERDLKAVRFYDSKSQKMRIRSFDKTAIVSFIHRFKYEIFENNSHCEVHIRTTMTLRQVDTGWRIVMEHSSAIQGIDRVTILKD